MSAVYRIQIRRTEKVKPWYWRMVSKNGRIVSTSETYANRSNAERAARKVHKDFSGGPALLIYEVNSDG